MTTTAPRSHRLWGGRFASDTSSAQAFEALNNSIDVDFRLGPFDIEASKAWAIALWTGGVLTVEESRAIESGLDRVAARLAAGEKPAPGDEDIHTMIDRLLHEEAGAVASKLHTGRSRNDQVATAARLWCIRACEQLDTNIRALQQTMLVHAVALEDTVMPGYTHLQRAIPVSAAHWMLSHFWPLERDRKRLRAARRSAAILPLGSGALAGSAYPVSRTLLQGTLGFEELSENSMDAVGDRDFIAELLFAGALLGAHLSRLAEDLILYGSAEFGFVQFGDAYTSGSSMMPQKRNPDALELTRGAAARVLGNHVALLATLKGLPSTYNKDLQEDKRYLFDAVDTLTLVLPALSGALAECRFDASRMRGAVSDTMLATDLADFLVRRGASFREAHGAVGTLIRRCESDKCGLSDLSEEIFASAHVLFDQSVREVLNADYSVRQREVAGGTGPRAVRAQLEAARAAAAN